VSHSQGQHLLGSFGCFSGVSKVLHYFLPGIITHFIAILVPKYLHLQMQIYIDYKEGQLAILTIWNPLSKVQSKNK
jgi:hypothetical protein